MMNQMHEDALRKKNEDEGRKKKNSGGSTSAAVRNEDRFKSPTTSNDSKSTQPCKCCMDELKCSLVSLLLICASLSCSCNYRSVSMAQIYMNSFELPSL